MNLRDLILHVLHVVLLIYFENFLCIFCSCLFMHFRTDPSSLSFLMFKIIRGDVLVIYQNVK